MYNRQSINELVSFIRDQNGTADKAVLSGMVQKAFQLTRDRSVFYGNDFAVRFCTSAKGGFSNTVLALSILQKYDRLPFIVCLVTPAENRLFLANTSFLRKISHSSLELRTDNIKGSFNGSDIVREFAGMRNEPENFENLFSFHENCTFEENLERLVEATNDIQPTGKRFVPTEAQTECIRRSAERAETFLKSAEYDVLDNDLRSRVDSVASEIAIAAFIDNVNLRGRVIEYLITSPDDLRKTLKDALHTGSTLPEIYTADKLGDYERRFDRYSTATDIKTKILFLSSNPKGYNIDKLLSFLAADDSIYLVYVVAIDEKKNISTRLCSMFNRQLLEGTRIIKQWAGRNSRGVTQYDGRALESIVADFDRDIDRVAAAEFIERCLNA